MVTHDWPLHVYNNPGAKKFLINKKPHFRSDIDNHQLGSPLYEILLNKLKPPHWFAAHLHIRFQTKYFHQSFQNNFDNRPPHGHHSHEAGDQQSAGNSPSDQARSGPEFTSFLALDKCLNRRRYLEFVDIASDEASKDLGLEYDLEWLAILRATDSYVSAQEYPVRQAPQPHVIMNYDDHVETEKDKVRMLFNCDFKVPNNFSITLPLNSQGKDADPMRVQNYVNEQTTRLCELLGITDPMQLIVNEIGRVQVAQKEENEVQETRKVHNPDQIDISDDEEDCCGVEESSTNQESKKNGNDNESDEPDAKRLKNDEKTPLFFIDKEGCK